MHDRAGGEERNIMKNILSRIHALARHHNEVSPELVKAKDIKLGLRNSDGTGVVVGITSKGAVIGYERVPTGDGGFAVKPVPGRLFYCGYDAVKLARNIHAENRFGFEEVAYLLLTGSFLPSRTWRASPRCWPSDARSPGSSAASSCRSRRTTTRCSPCIRWSPT